MESPQQHSCVGCAVCVENWTCVPFDMFVRAVQQMVDARYGVPTPALLGVYMAEVVGAGVALESTLVRERESETIPAPTRHTQELLARLLMGVVKIAGCYGITNVAELLAQQCAMTQGWFEGAHSESEEE